jgi:hypothetical protein
MNQPAPWEALEESARWHAEQGQNQTGYGARTIGTQAPDVQSLLNASASLAKAAAQLNAAKALRDAALDAEDGVQ